MKRFTRESRPEPSEVKPQPTEVEAVRETYTVDGDRLGRNEVPSDMITESFHRLPTFENKGPLVTIDSDSRLSVTNEWKLWKVTQAENQKEPQTSQIEEESHNLVPGDRIIVEAKHPADNPHLRHEVTVDYEGAIKYATRLVAEAGNYELTVLVPEEGLTIGGRGVTVADAEGVQRPCDIQIRGYSREAAPTTITPKSVKKDSYGNCLFRMETFPEDSPFYFTPPGMSRPTTPQPTAHLTRKLSRISTADFKLSLTEQDGKTALVINASHHVGAGSP